MFRLMKRAPWIVLGAAAAYLADPASGVTRRRRLRRRIEELLGGTEPRDLMFAAAPPDPRPDHGG